MNQPTSTPQDYHDSMQAAALGFLQRHQAEHLTDDGQLFERACNYLVTALQVPVFMAPRLVHLAMSQLKPAGPTWIGIDYAAGMAVGELVLVDTRTGQRACIPRRILPERFLAHAVTQ